MKTNCSTKINKLVLSIISVCVFIDFFLNFNAGLFRPVFLYILQNNDGSNICL